MQRGNHLWRGIGTIPGGWLKQRQFWLSPLLLLVLLHPMHPFDCFAQMHQSLEHQRRDPSTTGSLQRLNKKTEKAKQRPPEKRVRTKKGRNAATAKGLSQHKDQDEGNAKTISKQLKQHSKT